MDLRPLHDRVLVRRLEEQESKRGGLFIPDSAKKVADWTYPWVCGNCSEPKYATTAGN